MENVPKSRWKNNNKKQLLKFRGEIQNSGENLIREYCFFCSMCKIWILAHNFQKVILRIKKRGSIKILKLGSDSV